MNASLAIRQNRLLAALDPSDFALLAPHLKGVPLLQGAILQEAEAPVQHVCFPLSGMVSLVTIMDSGDVIETATVGREGAVGAFAGLGPWHAFNRAVVQLPGTAACIAAARFHAAVKQSEAIRNLILKFKEAVLAQVQQTAACNALHGLEARLARWLLQALDRFDDATLPLSQDALAQMLGVRRTSVSLTASKLQDAGLIRYRRARIDVIDRAGLEAESCECYATIRRRSDAVTPAREDGRGVMPVR